MARTKGSLNCSTIEKMKEVQEFERFKRIKEQMDLEYGIDREPTTINTDVSNSVQKNIQEVKDMEPTTKSTTEPTKPSEPININESNDTQASTEAPKKHRGRPRKNPVPENGANSDSSDSEPPQISKPSKEAKEIYPRCERCHTVIMCQPNKIDMDHLTNSAGYHRSFARFALLCPSCCDKLNQLVDEFLWNDGQGMEPKPYSDYGMKNFRKEDDDPQDNKQTNSSPESKPPASPQDE